MENRGGKAENLEETGCRKKMEEKSKVPPSKTEDGAPAPL